VTVDGALDLDRGKKGSHTVAAPNPASVADRFRISERAEPLCLREAEPHVYGYAWRLPGASRSPVASLVLVHGLQSHSGWFAECAETLLNRGFAVYTVDRRGSGASPGPRGDIEHYSDWFEEVAEVIRLARAEHPGAPTHLVGHCFGANVALGCVLTQRPEVRSLVMLTPGLYIRPDYSAWDKLRILGCALTRPQARFPVPQEDELFTRDADVLAWIKADPLGARTLTVRCMFQINRMLGRLRRGVGRLDVPLLVLEAERDLIADNRRNRALLDRALGGRCRTVSFDAEHFLLAEPCRDQVIETLVRWSSQEEPTV
jgi:alpha-beta hydrolase superfamily lysophospholipase